MCGRGGTAMRLLSRRKSITLAHMIRRPAVLLVAVVIAASALPNSLSTPPIGAAKLTTTNRHPLSLGPTTLASAAHLPSSVQRLDIPTFDAAQPFGTGHDNTYSVVTADMDSDGDLDLVVGNYGEQNVVYLNDGTGNFPSGHPFGTGHDATKSVAGGDLNGDGSLDIAVGNYGEQNVVYLNDGTGNFPISRPFGTGTDTTTSVAIGDIDGD